MFYNFYAAAPETRRCEFCGTAIDDIQKTGMVGCARCYETFADYLQPYIRRLHGDAVHKGNLPRSAGVQLRLVRELDRLRTDLSSAVTTQEFEKAAVLRDRITELEKNVKEAKGHE